MFTVQTFFKEHSFNIFYICVGIGTDKSTRVKMCVTSLLNNLILCPTGLQQEKTQEKTQL